MSKAYSVAAERWLAAAVPDPIASGHPFCNISPVAAEHVVYDIMVTEAGYLNPSDSSDLLRTISAAVCEECKKSDTGDLTVFHISSVLKKMCCMIIHEKELMRIDRDTWEKKQRLEAAVPPARVEPARARRLWKVPPSGNPPVPPPPPPDQAAVPHS
eukprot:6764906-Pyramimonas_sp.AAC.1